MRTLKMKKLITEGPKRTYEQIILDDMNVGCERIINNINDKVESLHKQDMPSKQKRIKFWIEIRNKIKAVNSGILEANNKIREYERTRIKGY